MVKTATLQEIEYVAARMRDIDSNEAKAILDISGRQALKNQFNRATESHFFEHDNKIYCVFGIGLPHTLWMIFTNDFGHLPISFFKESKIWTNRFIEKYGFIQNYTLVDNKFILDWVKWLGGTISEVNYFNNVPIRRWKICAMKS